MLQLGQFDAVILAQPVGQAGPLVADFVGGQIGGVNLLLQLADPAADLLDLGRPARLRCCWSASRRLISPTVCEAKVSLRR